LYEESSFKLRCSGGSEMGSYMEIINLKIQNFYEQIGIDRNPIFMWQLDNGKDTFFQSAYRIVISDHREDVIKQFGKIYNSGKIISDKQNNIEANVILKSHTKYYYRVCAWDEKDSLHWSNVSEFVTGIFNENDWKALWISNGTTKPFYSLKEIGIHKDVSQAYMSVSGLGQFKLLINGKKVGNHELDPGWTDYNKQVQYVTFDVANYLTKQNNKICIEVANGWYIGDASENRHFYTFNSGYEAFGTELPLIAQLYIKYVDGEEEVIITDGSWKTLQSSTTLSNVYGSEEFDGSRFKDVNSLFQTDEAIYARVLDENERPKGELTAQAHPPVFIKKIYDTVKITEPEQGKYIFDLGQNMSGLFEVFVKGKKGSKIKIIPVEKLTSEGKIDKSADTWSSYTLKGTGEVERWKPSFSYAAGRWVQIEGATRNEHDTSKPYIVDVKGHFITSSAEDAGTFSCSDKRYEDIFQIILKAIESNLNHVHTDCPTVEKLGWLETSHLMAPSVMYNKNVDTLWNKIARDVREAQYGEDEYDIDVSEHAHEYGQGLIPSIAPRYAKFLQDFGDGSFWDIVPWGSSVLLAVLQQYRFYGNKKVIEQNYISAKKYVDYLMDKYNRYNEIYNKQGEERFLCHGLGDWGIYGDYSESRENIETAFFYADIVTLVKFSEILGCKQDREYYNKVASEVLQNYNSALLVKNSDTGHWCYKAYDVPSHISVRQANQAIPLYFNMVPEDKIESVKESFFESVKNHQFISGEIGIRYIFSTLSKYERHDIIHDMIMQKEHPSYIRFVNQGETTLPEYWRDDARSRNHDMMGHIMEWFYSEIGGISSDDGYKNIRIAPHFPGGLTSVKCKYKAITGEIYVNAELLPDKLVMEVAIPANTIAKVYLPHIFHNDTVFCNGVKVSNTVCHEVHGGIYKFKKLCV